MNKQRKAARAAKDAEEKAAETAYNAALEDGKAALSKFDAVRQKVRDASDTGAFEPITGITTLPTTLATAH